MLPQSSKQNVALQINNAYFFNNNFNSRLSGFALTYLFADEETFLWRYRGGKYYRLGDFRTLGFLIANFAGLSIAIVLIALVISALPLILFTKKNIQKKFRRDWASAKGKLQGANYGRTLGFIYYAFFFFFSGFSLNARCLKRTEGFLRAARRISAICRFISARSFRLPTDKTFRRKILRLPTRNFPTRLSPIF